MEPRNMGKFESCILISVIITCSTITTVSPYPAHGPATPGCFNFTCNIRVGFQQHLYHRSPWHGVSKGRFPLPLAEGGLQHVPEGTMPGLDDTFPAANRERWTRPFAPTPGR